MTTPVDKLIKVLALERSQGHADRAVIGGLEAFLRHWRHDAAGRVAPTAMSKVAATLDGYQTLDAAARAERVEAALAVLMQTAEDLESAVPSQTEARRQTEARARAGAAAKPTEANRPAPLGASTGAELDGQRAVRSPGGSDAAAATPSQGVDEASLDLPVFHLRGFGVKSAEKLERLGIFSIRDLLFHFPARYEDFRTLKQIRLLRVGEEVTIVGTVLGTHQSRVSGGRALLRVTVGDTTGRIQATFFNQPWLEKEFRRGRQIVLSGRTARWAGRIVLPSPAWEPVDRDLVHTARLVPIYPLTEGLHQRWLRHRIAKAVEQYAAALKDPLPPTVLEEADLPSLSEAIQSLHSPSDLDEAELGARRLAFDELLTLQLWSLARRGRRLSQPGPDCSRGSEALAAFLAALPFQLTPAQARCLDEIAADMRGGAPMSRLLQGDVGSGKTAVAAGAAVIAMESGLQCAIMAPTEILAEQHYSGLCRLLAPLGYAAFDPQADTPPSRSIARLVGSMRAADKDQTRQSIAQGEVDLVVGTHAVIQESVTFARLGLAVVDEQHRFGVLQRAELSDTGAEGDQAPSPHQLVMTATPIPRTLALVLNADLDHSVIDELPPGRQPTETVYMTGAERERAYSFVRSRVAEGEQAFLIYPLVEASDKIDARSAVEEHARLSADIFPDLVVGLVHGRMSASDKDAAMTAFRDGASHILVATSVIEVGVDVPNATVMLIDGADRFGLAQLHQFRGRVGRGNRGGWCLLLADDPSESAAGRLKALVESSNGMELAELDLRMRGPGDYFGLQQSGESDRFKYARAMGVDLVTRAHRVAKRLIESDPELTATPNAQLAQRVSLYEAGAARK